MLTIVSGGQTGVDRAALDVAIEQGIPYRGWCPKGGWAEDRPSPACWPFMPDYVRRLTPTRASAPNGTCAMRIA